MRSKKNTRNVPKERRSYYFFFLIHQPPVVQLPFDIEGKGSVGRSVDSCLLQRYFYTSTTLWNCFRFKWMEHKKLLWIFIFFTKSCYHDQKKKEREKRRRRFTKRREWTQVCARARTIARVRSAKCPVRLLLGGGPASFSLLSIHHSSWSTLQLIKRKKKEGRGREGDDFSLYRFHNIDCEMIDLFERRRWLWRVLQVIVPCATD